MSWLELAMNDIGRVRVKERHTFVGVPSERADSIITALELGKRIIVMPRQASLGEHRNDHQVATAKKFAQQGRIEVAFNEPELIDKLDHQEAFDGVDRLSSQASQYLIESIRTFIEADGPTAR